MTLLTIGRYLRGNREAILQIASSRSALGVGLLFVLAAGFAREYDGEDLLREPWHLLIPLGASLASSAVLYMLVWFVAWSRKAAPPFLAAYLDFLGLYWMTAPLALLYAIPVERFLSAPNAIGANLWLLGIVAAWRVALMARVVSVIYRASLWEGFWLVMFFADSVLVVLLTTTPLPIVGIMGGIRLSEAEQVLYQVGWSLRILGVLTWPIWFVGAWVAAGLPILLPGSNRRADWSYLPAERGTSKPLPRSVWLTAVAALGIWVLILPFTQQEQQLRGQVERALQNGRIVEGLQTMSAHEESDFPPHWDPPPRLAYRERTPDIAEVQEHLDVLSVKPWVREIYVEKFGNSLRGEDDFGGVWREMPVEGVERRIALIERMPERTRFARDHEHVLKSLVGEYSELPAELQSRIRRLLDEAGVPADLPVEPATAEPVATPGAAPVEVESSGPPSNNP